MKKLLLVLLVVTLASFLFVGCIPSVPAEGEGEGEGEAEICPTVAVTSQVAVAGKTYIKAGSQTITVTFAVPTEPVSVYVGAALKDNPEGVPSTADEVVLYTADGGLTYTGTVLFAGDCDEAYIYVLTCDTCAPCKYPYKVDGVGPASEITIASKACVCEGVTLTFKTPTQATTCGVTGVCCGDACSGFASYAIDLYASDPFDVCCDIPCITPAYSCPGGVACPVDCELTCITGGAMVGESLVNKTYYVVASLLDNVGNRTRYYAKVVLDTDSIVSVTEFSENKTPTGGSVAVCTDWLTSIGTDVTIGICK
ncbi:hypothetical protein ES705_13887 [subsurface metagenome]